MIELKNSRDTYLGKWDGRDHHAIDASIGAIQMREQGRDWEDIKPRLVRDGNKLVSKDTPYRAEFGEDGSRLIFPDRTDLRKYVALPTVPLFQQATRIALTDRITMADPNTNMHFMLTNTGVKFQSLIKVPTFERITFDVDSVGFDIRKLLKAKEGVGIPRPRLIESDIGQEEVKERWLDWSYKNGQLELGFDLTGLRFPVLLDNTTVEVQTGASTSDGYTKEHTEYSSTVTTCIVGALWSASYNNWQLYTGITIPSGQQIDSNCYISEYVTATAGTAADRLTKIRAEDVASPSYPTTENDYETKARTTAAVDWDAVDTTSAWVNSPSIQSVIDELYQSHGPYSSGSIQIFHEDDGSVTGSTWTLAHWDYTGNLYGPKLHIEYSSAGVTFIPRVIMF